jgi:hypothetical protein
MQSIIHFNSLPGNPNCAYRVSREKLSGGHLLVVAHVGILFEYQNGTQMVLHRTPENNTHVSSLDEFASGQPIQKALIQGDLKEMIRRAHAILREGSQYSAILSNCEHLATFVIEGKNHSQQLMGATVGTGLAITACYTPTLKNQHWMVKAGVVLLGCIVGQKIAKNSLPGRS